YFTSSLDITRYRDKIVRSNHALATASPINAPLVTLRPPPLSFLKTSRAGRFSPARAFVRLVPRSLRDHVSQLNLRHYSRRRIFSGQPNLVATGQYLYQPLLKSSAIPYSPLSLALSIRCTRRRAKRARARGRPPRQRGPAPCAACGQRVFVE